MPTSTFKLNFIFSGFSKNSFEICSEKNGFNITPLSIFDVISISLVPVHVCIYIFNIYIFFFFQLYFCVLREENDIDVVLATGSLYDQVEGLEKTNLETCIL